MTHRNKDHSAIDHRHRRNGSRELAAFMTFLLLLCQSTVMRAGRAYGLTGNQIGQSPQEPGNAGDQKEVRSLEPGKPVKRELAGGQEHLYRVKLKADQFLKATIMQQDLDVIVRVVGPDGAQIMEVDAENRLPGEELVALVAESSGDYRLTVRPRFKGAGNYEIRIDELRLATDKDRALNKTRKQYKEALKLRDAGEYERAIPLFERILETREKLLGHGHPGVADVLNSLGVLYFYKGDDAMAESLYQRALSIREKALGPEHPLVAQSLNNLAHLRINGGDYVEAEALALRGLNIKEKALGPDHPDLDDHLHNLALVYHIKGDYAKAEKLYLRALKLREQMRGPDDPLVAQTVNNLANIYREMGDYAKAESLYRQALDIREKALGANHLLVGQTLSNLAILYSYQGNYAKAEMLHQRALSIREKALGPDHIEVAISLICLAVLYRNNGEYAKAEPLLLRALSIREKMLGPQHPGVATTLNELASLYLARGDYGKAEPLFQRALAIREKTLGPAHPDVAATLSKLAVLYLAHGEIARAVKYQERSVEVSERNLALNLSIGSESRGLAYLARLSGQADRVISLHLNSAPEDPTARDMAATLILQRKGRALDAASENLNSLRARFNKDDQALLDRLTETRSRIAGLVLNKPQRLTSEQYQQKIKELETQIEQDESEISRRSSEFRSQSRPVTLAAVRAAIPPATALIEFASYRPFKPGVGSDCDAYGQPRYAAYVLSREGEIKWADLGDAKTIDKAIADLREGLRNPLRKDVKLLARAVDAKVLQPVRPFLGDLNRLLISPDGLLNLISFAALVDEDGRYLIERYSISYLTSGRDLLRLQVARENHSGPLVIANPDFGCRSRIAAVHKVAWPEPQAIESYRSTIRDLYFPPLPYAAQEGEALRSLLPGVTLLTRGQATKAALSQVRGPEILHIATHGFFLRNMQSGLSGGRRHELLKETEMENTLLRSGLALAGANEHKEDDNGILTALEVTGLNLWGTKLVVLSACDTGVGEVQNGDGVHGLRRALVLAGAETQVMSLWSISDKATQELMVSYYRRLQEGEGRGEALRQVQLEMLKKVNRQHPYYWAGFIQSGEWANLMGKR